jgi:malate dehydrogenase (oxaloacetate-decarboxylating)(NADP+)
MDEHDTPARGRHDATGLPTGIDLLHDPALNKGTAFSAREREELGLRGLVPPRRSTIEDQEARILENFHRKPDDLEKYILLTSLQERNETLFYRVLVDHLEQMMPIVYTPTVGLACQTYGHIFRRPHGIFVSAEDRGRVDELLANWPARDVQVIVVTDGERILGLGDLGAQGMGIPVGKLALYTACAGLHPGRCLPITIDVGTNNEALLADPLYIGLPQRRTTGEAYDALVEELVMAAHRRYPHVVIQFEDFANHNAFRLLHEYRSRVCAFNDDIQGTAAVTLAGLYSAMRVTGGRLRDQVVLFLGAGEAGIGIADLIASAMVDEGLTAEQARRQCWFVDSRGLVVASRRDLAEHKLPYAHEREPLPDLLSAVEALRPTALIGVSGQGRTFSREVVAAMASRNQRPVVFALSNPTSNAECTAEEAYRWSDGRALFASGSPFDPVTLDGRTHVPGQGNNVYIFPGVGLGLVAAKARHVTDEMFMVAARTLAGRVTEDDLAVGRLYPHLRTIRDASAAIAVAVAEVAYAQGLADEPRPADLAAHVAGHVYTPAYHDYVGGG